MAHDFFLSTGLGPRERITYTLRFIFGDTFATGSFWYSNPDADQFIASLLHVASGGRVSIAADISGLFVRRANGTFHVCEVALRRLACTTQELRELLRRTPGALAEFRAVNAAPLLIPQPSRDEAVKHESPLPNLFDEALPPPLTFGFDFSFDFDDLSASMTSTTSLHGDGEDDDDLLDFATAFTAAAFEERSESEDTVDELLHAERELEAVRNRFRKLLPRRNALGDSPGHVTADLETLLEDVRGLRAAAEVERDADVARVFGSIF